MSKQTKPLRVMGILNVTPDSFSDGGRHHTVAKAVDHAARLLDEGADILDVGGESTRPGAEAVATEEELARVIPVVEAIKQRFDAFVSVDTTKTAVMRESIAVGADMINDVCALQQPGALQAVADSEVELCLMHMQGEPRTMQHEPRYDDVVCDVKAFLQRRIAACEEAGIARQRLWLDPGFGFGKSMRHNYQMLQRLQAFHELQLPLLIGMSRKSMIGHVTGRAVDERLAGSIAAATIAALKGARIIRVHDVKETVDAMKVVAATLEGDYL
ncbi:dihydropteroate synthase [Idiomarina sp. OT37-5b]|jgi:dihydropteroate synthase|uniref:dihydropteroate synthase n=1 Tax=Idiomarina sp. OT37-5b TaxID=2100422 RepID=UPI000CF89246|nr:dihydropteroate synthase [Idiomarina sp. OT37-5b]AVJ55539.1 dihydropteroate synthase [Idiomarina sp. OT37-5b]